MTSGKVSLKIEEAQGVGGEPRVYRIEVPEDPEFSTLCLMCILLDKVMDECRPADMDGGLK